VRQASSGSSSATRNAPRILGERGELPAHYRFAAIAVHCRDLVDVERGEECVQSNVDRHRRHAAGRGVKEESVDGARRVSMTIRGSLVLVTFAALAAALAILTAQAAAPSAHRGVDDPQHLYDW
jgi:hypothetical protein